MVDATAQEFVPSAATAEIRARLGHPIIDADGHLIEFMPYVFDLVREHEGARVAERLENEMKARTKARPLDREHGPRSSFWVFPARNTLDRATCVLPELLYRRLDEIGVDFALVYPSFGLNTLEHPDPENRRIMSRAYNEYYAAAYGSYRDRLEPVAAVPAFTPQEALDALEHAVIGLGLKTIVMSARVLRTSRFADGRESTWVDTLGHDSLYDYDPVWQRCVELGVSPSFHGTGHSMGFRVSSTNYVYNHLGNFSSGQEAACRSLFMGGVPFRFPQLRFSFLEGGVTWAAQLLSDIISHYEKRNRDAIMEFDPQSVDVNLYRGLFERFGGEMLAHDKRVESDLFERAGQNIDEAHSRIDDFEESGIKSTEDPVRIFGEQYFFGCEADDAMNALAFNQALLPGHRQLNAMFASDIGHWDVPDARNVVPEAWEMVEKGYVSEEDFRSFTFSNAATFLTGNNPDFFEGTSIDRAWQG
jgi:predicted TIM-barrel fold metal-dependent hydrolase